jgi:Cu-processing system permease protein
VKHPVLLIAQQEFVINRRNKWITSFAILFAILTFLISYFGMATSGYAGFQDFARTSTSLIQLSGFLIPLFALLLGVFSFISYKEYLEILVCQPVSRFQVILGKYIGLIFTLIGASVLGYTIPGVVIALVIGTAGAVGYILTVIFSIVLGVIFLGFAVLISLLANRQQIALGISIGVWIFFEVIYGLLVFGTTIYFKPLILKFVLIFALFGNPVDIIRVVSLISVGGLEFFGPGGATLYKLAGSEIFAMIYGITGICVWLFLPLLMALKKFSKQDIY